MGRAVLSLLRSAAQPVMAEAGRALARAADRPGLALIPLADHDASSGTVEQHRRGADLAGAQTALLDGAGHWWPIETPEPGARALERFWSGLAG